MAPCLRASVVNSGSPVRKSRKHQHFSCDTGPPWSTIPTAHGPSHISEEDRRAAAVVTTSGSGHRFEIQLGHLCNNRCVFCSSGQLTR